MRRPTVTAQQARVLAHIEAGCTDRETARALGISRWTVRQHVKRLLVKFPGRVTDMPRKARAAGIDLPRAEAPATRHH